MPRTLVTRWLQALAVLLCGGIAGAHPLDPLTADVGSPGTELEFAL